MKTYLSVIIILAVILATTPASAIKFQQVVSGSQPSLSMGHSLFSQIADSRPRPGMPLALMRNFKYAIGSLTLTNGMTGFKTALSGSASDQLNTNVHGAASDTDGNGLDQITMGFNSLGLSGEGPLGTIHVSLRPLTKYPYMASYGEMEEQTNNNPGILDLVPFTPTGASHSTFHVWIEIDIEGVVYHNNLPWYLWGAFQQTPPKSGESYLSNPVVLTLYDENNNATPLSIMGFEYVPVPWLVRLPLIIRN
jgi:hypothetical protein